MIPISLLILGLVAPQETQAQAAHALLADRCFRCHGPDANSRMADLRLDERDAALALRKNGVAIEPGQASHSLLIQRINAESKGLMPPPSSKLTLSPQERQLLRDWVDAGANYPQHWAFAPLKKTPPPRVEGEVSDPLDAFVHAALAKKGHKVAAPVAPGTWLRRASLVLTGLPPALEEIHAFEAQDPATRREDTVTRLLASTRFGEHLAAPWLDAARYADTYGYQNDVYRAVWPYRDWVINAFNRNLSYDAFITEQIAGDLLPDATDDQIIATAFNRLHRQTNEGGSIEEEYRSEYVADRVDTLGTAIMGLTMTCSRCHDHKYDPIPQTDFYSLAAFFDNIDESGLYPHFTSSVPTPTHDITTPKKTEHLKNLRADILRLEQELAEVPFDLEAYAAWRRGQEQSSSPPAGLYGSYLMDEGAGAALLNQVAGKIAGGVRGPVNRVTDHPGGGLQLTGDHPLIFAGNPTFRRWDAYSFGLWISPSKVVERAVVLHRSKAWHDAGSRGYQLLLEEMRPSYSMIHFWPGNAVRVRAKDPVPVDQWTHIAITHDGSGRAAGLKLFINGRPADTEVIRDHLTRTITGGGAGHLTIGERFRDLGFRGGRVDDLLVFDRELTADQVALMAHLDDKGAITGWSDPSIRETSWPVGAWLLAFMASPADTAREAKRKELRDARMAVASHVDSLTAIMVMKEMPKARPTHILNRGAYDQPGKVVQPGTLSCLPPLKSTRNPTRLDLARWLTAPDHPLTSRVAVDRFWRLIFGRGLVGTPENFGVQGIGPWSPGLLDTLALDFMASGWDVKGFLKRLVLSDTFARVSCAIPGADPRRRLSAESLRDQVLFQSGLLVEKVGGAGVKPYQPAGLWREKSGSTYHPDKGSGLYRRSLYTFWKRTSPPPSMLLLDASKRDVCAVNRPETSTPLQALVFWNDPQYVEASRVLAGVILREDVSSTQRLERLYQRLTARIPSPEETGALTGLLDHCLADYKANPDQAQALIAVGATAVDAELDPAALASWTLLISTLFSHHAVVSIQ